MLRALVVLLLLANLGYFAWMQGWLAPVLAPPQRVSGEPERVAAQVKPELITVMSPKAASAAAAAARPAEAASVCLEAGPFAEAALAGAEAVLTQAGVPEGSWTREAEARASSWAVYMGRFGDAEVMRSKADELRQLKVPFEEVRAPPLLAPGLKLSTHGDRAGAEASLAQLGQRGVRSARVVELSSGATEYWLRAARADGELQARLKGLPAGGLASGFVPCRKPGAG